MAPTTVDGLDIDDATIDGTEVSEITVDGNVVFKAGSDIPDSAIAQYDAQALIGFNDGDSITTWEDNLNNNDITGETPVYRDSAINGNPAVEFDGNDDYLETALPSSISQPTTVITVGQIPDHDAPNEDGAFTYFDNHRSSNNFHLVRPQDTESNSNEFRYRNNAGETFETDNGTATTNPEVLVNIFDGNNSEIRRNGSDLSVTGESGTNDLEGIQLGSRQDERDFFDGYIAEVITYDDRLTSSEIEEEEQRLSDKWGISLD